MSQQAKASLTNRAIDLPSAIAAIVGDQWYLVDTPDGGLMYVRGEELRTLPAQVIVRAIAWRV